MPHLSEPRKIIVASLNPLKIVACLRASMNFVVLKTWTDMTHSNLFTFVAIWTAPSIAVASCYQFLYFQLAKCGLTVTIKLHSGPNINIINTTGAE